MPKKSTTETTLIIVVYTLAHGLIFLNNGIFWDDWTLYHNESGQILENFRQVGGILTGYIHSALLSFDNSIFLYRAVVFFSYLFSALLLNGILKTVNEIDELSRIFIVIFFAIFPVNSARVAMIIAPSAFYYFLFFLGFWMTSRVVENGSFVLRIATLIVFFLSFFHNSFLFFFSIVLLYIFYREKGEIISFRTFFDRLIRYSDFVLLPIIFWVMKIIFLTPYGLSKGYNHLGFHGILFALRWIPVASYTSFMEIALLSFEPLSLTIIICGLVLMMVIVQQKTPDRELRTYHKSLFVVGLFSFFAGVFPYLAVYGVPQVYDWANRHQRLTPLGAAFILYYGLKILFDKLKVTSVLQIFVFSIIVFLFMNTNIKGYLEWQKDWYKQLSLIENFRTSEIMKNRSTFLFTDHTLDMNANQRTYRVYEYFGLMKYAFGNETRFGENYSRFESFKLYKGYLNKTYNIREYIPSNPEFNVVIDYGDYKVDTGRLMRLMIREYFTHDEFLVNIKRIVRLTFIPIQ